MTITRRRFAQYIGAALALLHLPKPVIASGLPRLVGDGFHNDAPALQALLARKPIEIGPLVDVTGAGWSETHLTLPMGKFALHEPIRLYGVENIILSGQVRDNRYRTMFFARPEGRICNDSSIFAVEGCKNLTIENMFFSFVPADQIDAQGWAKP